MLYAPPPAAAGPYAAILESEGLNVLIANGPDSAAVLLANASPALIIALVPILGDELRDLFRKHAPNAEVRVIPGLSAVIEDAVLKAAQAVLVWVHQGVAACMNRFNPDETKKDDPPKKDPPAAAGGLE